MLRKTVVAAALCLAVMSGSKADEGLVSFKIMTLETAQELARNTLISCREKGYQVTVAVVDRFGNPQVLLRDRFAGPHTPETATRKAWTAVSFRTHTLEMGEITKAGTDMSGIRHIGNALAVGGGIPVTAGGKIVGGVGVSGAPGGDADHACAEEGVESVVELLEF